MHKTPRVWAEVVRQARQAGEEVNVGRVFPIVSVKNFESAEEQVLKGRIVFQGSDIRDEDSLMRFFEECASSPAHLGAVRLSSALRLLSAFCLNKQMP